MTQPMPIPVRPDRPIVTDADLEAWMDAHPEVCCEMRAVHGWCECAEFLVDLAVAPTIVGRWW